MAAKDRTSLDFPPEIKLARALVEARKLVPPVPVEEVLREYADVREDEFPGKWDALLLQRTGARPEVILSRVVSPNANRRRFTLAHELGHLIIPWSIGTLFCHPDVTVQLGEDLLGSIEAESNRFASELLVPREWLSSRLERAVTGALAPAILEYASEAQVSPIVVALATPRLRPPGTHVFTVDDLGRIRYPTQSTGSLVKLPLRWDASLQSDIRHAGGLVSVVDFGPHMLVAVEFPDQPMAEPEVQTREEDQTTMLRAILASCFDDDMAREQARMSITGIIGATNNSLDRSASQAQLFCALRQRFVAREGLRGLLANPDFTQFLCVKAATLFLRRQGRTKNSQR